MIREIIYPDDLPLLKAICYGCDSKNIEKTYNYIRTLYYRSKNRVIGEIIPGIGFYLAVKNKASIRAVALAVTLSYKGKGYGRMLHERLVERSRKEGFHTMTIRTDPQGPQLIFMLNRGFNEVGQKENDIEMELNI